VWGDIKQLTYRSKELLSREMLHTIQKPERLIERIIKASSNPKDYVLDPFVGSGTVPVVCERLNRNFIGCEINAKYLKIAKERLLKSRQNKLEADSKSLFSDSQAKPSGLFA
jgi:DNA modification methylase